MPSARDAGGSAAVGSSEVGALPAAGWSAGHVDGEYEGTLL